MATVETLPPPTDVAAPVPLRIGPNDTGRRLTLDEFVAAEWEPGYDYELSRDTVIVTEVAGITHGRIVARTSEMFVLYDVAHRGWINYRAGGGECRIRLLGAVSDRHPDQASYLTPPPPGKQIWHRWVPAIAVEVVSHRGEECDYVLKRIEYHRFGIREY